jgi:hypothetical protein
VDGGTEVTIGKSDTTVTDEDLSFDTTYCYKIFWYDDLENVTTATASGTTGDPSDCTLDDGHNVWYNGADVIYSIDCPVEITSASLADFSGSFLSLSTTLPTDDAVTIEGVADSVLDDTWDFLLNGEFNYSVDTEVLAASATFTTASYVDITDNTDATYTIVADLDSTYDGATGDVSIKGLMGDSESTTDTTSNGSVTGTETDIPSLTYTDTSGCGDAASPWICPSATSYATGSTDATATMTVNWNFGIFDQGEYFVDTIGYTLADNAPIYESAASTTRVIVPDQGADTELEVYATNVQIGHNEYYGDTDFYSYIPAVSVHEGLSSTTTKVTAWSFAATQSDFRQFLGISDVTPATNATAFNKSILEQNFQLSGNVNALSASISESSGDTWIAVTGQASTGGFDLVLNRVNYDSTTIGSTDADFVNVTNWGAATHEITSVAIAPAFDDNGTDRHGVAFYASQTTAGTKKIYIAKLTANTSPTDPAFDVTGYSDATNDMDAWISSVEIADIGGTVELVKIINAVETGTEYFYVGWIDKTNDALQFVRAVAEGSGGAAGANIPTLVTTETGNKIDNMDPQDGALGRPYYSIAAGKDKSGNYILGVLYVLDNDPTDSDDAQCFFQAYTYDSTDLVKDGNALAVSTDNSGDTNCNTTEECACRYPNLFFNPDVGDEGEFIAAFVENVSDSSTSGTYTPNHKTYVTSFVFNEASTGSLEFSDNGNGLQEVIDYGSDTNDMLCHLGVNYSAEDYSLSFISNVGFCSSGGITQSRMLFDVYKTKSN